LNDGTVGRTTLGVRAAKALLTASFGINPFFAAPPDFFEAG
jgi:hypothetical protein